MGPSSLEVKLAEILISAVVLLGLGTWTGYHFTREHYELVQQKEKTASEAVLANARQAIIDLTLQRDKALQQLESDHAQWVKTDSESRARAADSVRGLTGALRACAVSRTVADSAGRPGGGPGGGAGGGGAPGQSGGELDAALTEYAAANDNLVAVCQAAGRSLKSIYAVAPRAAVPSK